MSWLCLNGVMSTTIRGLLIQTLPPISKPMMRTSIEEIDGRDGDIVTKLGYAAYDKEITIGLHGEFDVDTVISFFDSEGEVIFSNEPDKFYRYQIIEQIDFEKLIRYKTATVTFHVQPFKFSAVDDSFVISSNVLRLGNYNNGNTLFNVKTTQDGAIQSVVVNVMMYDKSHYMIPISTGLLNGNYTLKLSVSSEYTIPTNANIRIIGSEPTDADSLGGQAFLLNNAPISQSVSVSNKRFNYIYLDFPDAVGGTGFKLSFVVRIDKGIPAYYDVFNRGNVVAKPRLTVYGSGNIVLKINNNNILTIALASDEYIVIDSEEMNAYKGTTLKNRSVSGDYSDLKFPVGTCRLAWTGTVTDIMIEKGSRWL